MYPKIARMYRSFAVRRRRLRRSTQCSRTSSYRENPISRCIATAQHQNSSCFLRQNQSVRFVLNTIVLMIDLFPDPVPLTQNNHFLIIFFSFETGIKI